MSISKMHLSTVYDATFSFPFKIASTKYNIIELHHVSDPCIILWMPFNLYNFLKF